MKLEDLSFARGRDIRELSHTWRRETMWVYGEKTAIHSKRSLEGKQPRQHLALDFYPSELGENKYLLLDHLGCGILFWQPKMTGTSGERKKKR
jgi:hypothetical protein